MPKSTTCLDCTQIKDHYGRSLCRDCWRHRRARGLAMPPRTQRTAASILAASSAGRGPTECWPWDGYVEPRGYGFMNGHSKRYRRYAHRYSWESVHGPIPDGLKIDHTCHTYDLSCFDGDSCRHRRCVNPSHMELVPGAENSRRAHHRRQTECRRGHPQTAENVRVNANGTRSCRACERVRDIERRRSQGVPPRHDWAETCPNGHTLTAEIFFTESSGTKRCRLCQRAQSRARNAQITPDERARRIAYLVEWRRRRATSQPAP